MPWRNFWGLTWCIKVWSGASRPTRQILIVKSSAADAKMLAEIQRKSQIQPAWNLRTFILNYVNDSFVAMLKIKWNAKSNFCRVYRTLSSVCNWSSWSNEIPKTKCLVLKLSVNLRLPHTSCLDLLEMIDDVTRGAFLDSRVPDDGRFVIAAGSQ